MLVETTADLIKLASDKEEQLKPAALIRSRDLSVQNCNEASGLCRPYTTQLVNIGEEEEDATEPPETSALMVESKAKPAKDSMKSPGNYPFPLATNQSRKVPPQPCRNCGSPLHYDRDCVSWRSQGWPQGKIHIVPAGRTSDTYHKSYVTMLEEDHDNYDSYCATYNVLVDEAPSIDVLLAEASEDLLSMENGEMLMPLEPWKLRGLVYWPTSPAPARN